MAISPQPKLNWDLATAYDLFISLRALHEPENFGLRASWAAGVRSRLPSEHRQTLELAQRVMSTPLYYAYHLPAPKDAATALKVLQDTAPARRLEKLFFCGATPAHIRELLTGTRKQTRWSKADRGALTEFFGKQGEEMEPERLDEVHQVWSEREAFGEAYATALEVYITNFFAEEEQRIQPVIKSALSHAQMRAGSRTLAGMLEELSAGIRYANLSQFNHVCVAPSFWAAPYLYYEYLDNKGMLLLFGGRPDSMAIIPGEIVPDTLIIGLKALADSTRLRILRHLTQSQHTAAQLSRTLRLRPPTVNHHLSELRMAGVVQVTITQEGEKVYSTRFEGFETIEELLHVFVRGE